MKPWTCQRRREVKKWVGAEKNIIREADLALQTWPYRPDLLYGPAIQKTRTIDSSGGVTVGLIWWHSELRQCWWHWSASSNVSRPARTPWLPFTPLDSWFYPGSILVIVAIAGISQWMEALSCVSLFLILLLSTKKKKFVFFFNSEKAKSVVLQRDSEWYRLGNIKLTIRSLR